MNKIREAISEDMKVVYMMGYDVWGDKMPSEEYVTMCHDSSKYKKGKWYILEDTNTKKLLSSLIIYELNASEDFIVKGIGSISTPLHLRQKGHASMLVKETLNELEHNEKRTIFFLYSDIGSDFYKRLNFIEIPDSRQKYKDSVCMYYSKENNIDFTSFEIPNYF